jgi:RNA polymerase sigma-70 factor (ECF subfamily)
MLQVKAGNTDKLALLFERHHKPLFGFFYHLTQNRQSSEDLVQNTFYRILKYSNNFQGEGTFRAWMYSIARNSSADFFNKNKNHHTSEEISYWEDKLPAGSNIVDKISDIEDKGLLKTALTKMDPEKREILILSKFQGMKYKEIGLVMNCSENTVKVKVHRALETLKKIYCQLNINKDYDL